MGTENARFFSVRPGVPCLFEPRLVKMGKRKEFGDVLDGLFGKTPPIYSDDLAALLNAASIDDAMRNAAFLNGKSRCILEVSRDVSVFVGGLFRARILNRIRFFSRAIKRATMLPGYITEPDQVY